jgi:hypothetical protein
MEDYKIDIANTRKGCLGSSDAKMLATIATQGVVPKSAYNRLAVCKGLIEQTDIPYTDAVRFGDETEQAIFEYLSQSNEGYESNPLWVSKTYSRKWAKCISHPDITRKDDKTKTLFVYEIKASKFTTEQVRNEYKFQLFQHWLLAKEQVKNYGKDWKIQLYLVHYQTEGLDLSQPQEFDVDRLVIKRVRFGGAPLFDLNKAMDVVDAFLETFDFYSEGEEIQSEYLPEKVKQEFDTISNILAEIKEREQKVADFKAKLFDFMLSKDIKSIKSELWSITRVDATESTSVDYKAIFEKEFGNKPIKARKLQRDFKKTTKKRGYVQIKTKDNNNN